MSKKENDDKNLKILAKYDGTQINIKTNLRLVAALDNLIGNGIDLINNRIERSNKLYAKQTELLIEELNKNQEISTIQKASLERKLRQHHNREAIADECLSILSETLDKNDILRDDQIEDDWLNYFGDHAEKATSSRMRKMWALILAGEIKRPGSFSLATLRFISELDQQIAELFQKHTKIRFNFNPIAILRPDDLSGQTLVELSLLEECGLLKNVTSGTVSNFREGEWHYCFERSIGKLILLGNLNSDISIPFIMMTRVAIEILEICDPVDELKSLKILANKIAPQANRLAIGRISKIHNETFNYDIIEKIK